MNPNAERLLISDASLRDGVTSSGYRMTREEKLHTARALAGLGVDIIEAGFPARSRVEWESVSAVAREIEGPVICGFARCNRDDIELAHSSLSDSPRRRIHVFLGTSRIRQQKSALEERILRTAIEGVTLARDLCEDVEFSLENGFHTEPAFLTHVFELAIDAGASTLNVLDTCGHATPDEVGEILRYIRRYTRGIQKSRLSVHCHDDIGLAVANSLSAVMSGARQIECTLNGIGERTNNCSLQRVVMALQERDAFFNVRTNIEPTRLLHAARVISTLGGVRYS